MARKTKQNKGGQQKHKNGGLSSYCSLCGDPHHKASEGCSNMHDNAGKPVTVMPSHNVCCICLSFVSPRLNHPPSYCPFRAGGPFSNNWQLGQALNGTDSPPTAASPLNDHIPTSKSETIPSKISRVEELFKLPGLNKLAATSTFGLKINSLVSDSDDLTRIVDIGGDAGVDGLCESKEESRKIFIPQL